MEVFFKAPTNMVNDDKYMWNPHDFYQTDVKSTCFNIGTTLNTPLGN